MKELDYLNFGLEIMLYRKRKRMNQEEFAKAARLSRNMISMIERGEVSISVETLFKLSIAAGVEPCDLLKSLTKA